MVRKTQPGVQCSSWAKRVVAETRLVNITRSLSASMIQPYGGVVELRMERIGHAQRDARA